VLLPIIVFLFLFILLFSGNKEKEPIDLGKNYNFENPENYLFYQEDGKTILQNKNLEFSFEIPDSWTFEGFQDDFSSGLNLLSSDYEEDENSLLKNGCKSIITIYEEEDDYLYLEEVIDRYKDKDIVRDNAEIIEIDGISGYITGKEETSYYKNIKVPLDNKIYSVEGLFSIKEKKLCEETYDDLLNSISFSKNEE
jgi:hypothetical protein